MTIKHNLGAYLYSPFFKAVNDILLHVVNIVGISKRRLGIIYGPIIILNLLGS